MEKGSELLAGLRKTVEDIDQTTGIPKAMVLDRENGHWTLKSGTPFSAGCDEAPSDDSRLQSLLDDAVAEGYHPPRETAISEGRYPVPGSPMASKVLFDTKVGIAKNFGGRNRLLVNGINLEYDHQVGQRTGQIQSRELEKPIRSLGTVMMQERATSKLVGFATKVLSTVMRELRRSRPLALSRNVRPLVPGRVRTHARIKSVSLVTQGPEATIKPFALYSIKKDRIATSTTTESTGANTTPRTRAAHSRVATEESKARKHTESVTLSKVLTFD